MQVIPFQWTDSIPVQREYFFFTIAHLVKSWFNRSSLVLQFFESFPNRIFKCGFNFHKQDFWNLEFSLTLDWHHFESFDRWEDLLERTIICPFQWLNLRDLTREETKVLELVGLLDLVIDKVLHLLLLVLELRCGFGLYFCEKLAKLRFTSDLLAENVESLQK